MENKENKGAAFGRAPPGRCAPRRLFSLLSLAFFHFWAIILAIRMITQAFRMIELYHPNHPRLSQKPAIISPSSPRPSQSSPRPSQSCPKAPPGRPLASLWLQRWVESIWGVIFRPKLQICGRVC